MRFVDSEYARTNLVNLKPRVRSWNSLQLAVSRARQVLAPFCLLGSQRRRQTNCEEQEGQYIEDLQVHGLAHDCDLTSSLALTFQGNLHIPFPQQARKFLSLLNQQNAAFEPECLQSHGFKFA